MWSANAVLWLLHLTVVATYAFPSGRDSDHIRHDPFLDEQLLSGYIRVGGHGGAMFYILAPYKNHSIDDPRDKDVPFALWLTGGPGCSSETALFEENGPLKMSPNGQMSRNPHSWSNAMHMVYIDQPLGTGFSAVGGWLNYATDETRVAAFLREFLVKFVGNYPMMRNRQMFITGESFAGHYIPAFTDLLLREPIEGVNIGGIAMGNAWVDPQTQYLSMPYYALLNDLISAEDYTTAKDSFNVCAELIDAKLWPVALLECSAAAAVILQGRNPYDIRLNCEIPPLCYNFTNLETFMNEPVVQARLGTSQKWEFCNTYVRMFMFGDWISTFQQKVSHILENHIPVLVYSGDKDYVCNWIGGVSWTMTLDWPGSAAYNATLLAPWMVGKEAAGEAKAFGELSFLRVYDAGHMSPMDQPARLLAMVEEFIKNKRIEPTVEEAMLSASKDVEFLS